ncbi:hypothetical protein WJX74_004492 [Apatococcus lobatus]|uniref:Centrosomal protein POC5 n=1 Tax=Apatococcus lobatus TaxID=904363 RepID=A0AAW1SEA5_9CHLO
MQSQDSPEDHPSSQHMFTARVEQQQQRDKHELLVWYNDVRSALLAEWEEGRAEQVSSWAAQREEMQQQLDSYRSAAVESDVLIGKYEQYLDRLSGGHHRSSQRYLQARALQAWRRWSTGKRTGRAGRRQAHAHYNTRKLQCHVLRSWRAWSVRTSKSKAADRMREATEAGERAAWAAANAIIADVQARLEASQAEVKEVGAAKQRMEQAMKRSFMRGVCALNLEALQVMKRGAPQEDPRSAPLDEAESMPEEEPAAQPAQQIKAYPGAYASSSPMPAATHLAQECVQVGIAEQLQGKMSSLGLTADSSSMLQPYGITPMSFQGRQPSGLLDRLGL